MQDTLLQIKQLIAERQIKKAEILIARLMRNTSPSQPDHANLLLLRARLNLLAGRPHNALEDLQMVSPEAWDTDYLQRFADAHLARYEQAVVGFVQKQDLQQARRIYEQIIQDYPEYANRAWVEYQLGRLTLIENSVEEAIKHLNNALEAPQPREYPELAALCYERLGYIAYYEQRNLRQALDYLAQAISHYPAGEPRSWLIQVYLLRARILREQNLNKAYEAAAEAVQIASNEASKTRSGIIEALFAVAEILAEMPGREDELVLVLRRFIQLDKAPVGVDVTWSRVYEMLGNAYMALLEYSQAIPAYEEALRFNPYHPWSETLQYRVAVAQYQLGQYADTVTFLRTLLDNGVETETYRIYVLLGNAQFAQGAFTEAQKSYAEALRNAPAGIDTSTVQAYYEASSRLAVPI